MQGLKTRLTSTKLVLTEIGSLAAFSGRVETPDSMARRLARQHGEAGSWPVFHRQQIAKREHRCAVPRSGNLWRHRLGIRARNRAGYENASPLGPKRFKWPRWPEVSAFDNSLLGGESDLAVGDDPSPNGPGQRFVGATGTHCEAVGGRTRRSVSDLNRLMFRCR